MRYVSLLVGVLLLGLASSYGWSWYASGLIYPESIGGTQRQIGVMIGGMILLGCGFIAAGIGSWKQAGLEGFVLGLIGGPLGAIVAFVPDNRPKCPQCSGRVDTTARICPHCQTAFARPKPSNKTDSEGQRNRNAGVDRRHADRTAERKRDRK